MLLPPPILWSAALTFVLASGSLPRLANAASIDKESEVEIIFQRLESDARAFRDEIEHTYGARCETKTLTDCYKGSFNDCSSTYPNQQCLQTDEFVMSACGDGVSCNGLWDKSVTKVSIPASLGGDALVDIPEVIETVCYSLLAESYMVEKYEADEEYWATYNVMPSWTYFGAHNGLFRQIPAIHQEVCGGYDPRRRPWFVAASSGPKDVVIILDVSGSMLDYGRMDIAKEAAIVIVETLTVADRFAVIAFSSDARQVGGFTSLIRATNVNKEEMVRAINELQAQGGTNFYNAFENAFNALEDTIRNESTSGCNIAILFMTDGQISEGPGTDAVIGLVNERTQQIASDFDRSTTIFTFSLGHESDQNVTKTIACSTGGIWTPVLDLYGDLISAMSSYYTLYALGLGEGGNGDFVAWVEPYKFYTRGVMGTTVSVPVYDRNVTPPLFLGVVAVDSYMSDIEQILGEDASSSTMLDRFVSRSTARCPKIDLTECELEALRFLSAGKVSTCGVCNNTSYTGIVPEKCPLQSDLPKDIWVNSDMADKEFTHRACCESNKTVPSDSCPAVHPIEEVIDSWSDFCVGALIGLSAIGGGIYICKMKQKQKQEAFMHFCEENRPIPNATPVPQAKNSYENWPITITLPVSQASNNASCLRWEPAPSSPPIPAKGEISGDEGRSGGSGGGGCGGDGGGCGGDGGGSCGD